MNDDRGEYMPDGIHPSETGFRAIMNNVFDRGAQRLVDGLDWQ